MSKFIQSSEAYRLFGINQKTLATMAYQSRKQKNNKVIKIDGLLYLNYDEMVWAPRVQARIMQKYYDLMAYFNDDEIKFAKALAKFINTKSTKYSYFCVLNKLMNALCVQYNSPRIKANVALIETAMQELEKSIKCQKAVNLKEKK